VIASDSTPFGRGLASRFSLKASSRGVSIDRYRRRSNHPPHGKSRCRARPSRLVHAITRAEARHLAAPCRPRAAWVMPHSAVGGGDVQPHVSSSPRLAAEFSFICRKASLHHLHASPGDHRGDHRGVQHPPARRQLQRASRFGRTFPRTFPRGPTPSCLKQIHTRDWT
jgi:hypothetical protein